MALKLNINPIDLAYLDFAEVKFLSDELVKYLNNKS
jgi:hypothetical protein